ncbi:MAG: hypothetical protein GX247_02840 [Mollicutes bacterium]|nr:hypothetical protein [Mollicutes bacterium]
MRKIILSLFFISVLIMLIVFQKEIVEYIMVNYIYQKEIVVENANKYKRNYNYYFVQQTDNFFPKSKQDLMNIFYSILNNGWNTFTFYCDIEYETCIKDIQEITQDEYILSNINNFVHPYNSYNHLSINYNNLGKIVIKVEKLYSDFEVKMIDQKIEEIYNKIITEDMSIKKKILAIHDYIIHNTSYDSERAEMIQNNINDRPYKYQSHKAYGPLIQNMAICSGYSDTMALFLNKMELNNYKIASQEHIWNLVYLDGQWYHLDLTWDDPVIGNGKSMIIHNYFLITTEELEKEMDDQHEFSKEVYSEAK